MLISTVATYRCNGCGAESPSPYGWRSFSPVHVMGNFYTVSSNDPGEHYCVSCANTMREAVKKVPLSALEALGGTRPEVEAKVPPAVRMAIRVLLNHVEPGWENCQLVVQSWLDDAVPAAAVERREPQRDGS